MHVYVHIYMPQSKMLLRRKLMQLKSFTSIISTSSLIFLKLSFLRCEKELIIGPTTLGCVD